MGSSPSKNDVVHIRISSSKGRKDSSDNDMRSRKISSSSPSISDQTELRKEISALQSELNTQKDMCSQAEEMSFSFQTELDEREREVLLLREELSSLQSATSSTTNTMSDREMEMMPKETGDNFDRTVHAKNQYIKTLEDDLKNIRQHTTTQSDRYQKKLKKLRGTLSKSRQDSSLKLFELKDENTKLTEKNTKLQEHIERLSMDSGDSSRQGSASSDRSLQQSHDKTINDDSNDHHDDPRMKLILELSEQVTNLDAENFKLKQELRHCRKIAEKVEKVRMQTKKSSGRTADIVVVEKSQSSWKALESSSSRLEIGEQA